MVPKTYTTKELSKKTWSDLETLFKKPGIGDAWWCWCTFHHTARFLPTQSLSRAERAVENRQQKKTLVEKGQSHGILVYEGDDPIGWCQYGPSEELPRVDHSRNYQGTPSVDAGKLWRITCFVVDKEHRRKGVATTALNAAVKVIENEGGGVVEGFPVSKTDQGAGYMYTGRVSMFERASFKTVGPFGKGRTKTTVMRKTV